MKRTSLILAAVLIAGALAAGATCAPQNVCSPDATRCAGANTAQLCNERGQWVDVMDCGAVTGGAGQWECQLDDESQMNTCLEPDSSQGGGE